MPRFELVIIRPVPELRERARLEAAERGEALPVQAPGEPVVVDAASSRGAIAMVRVGLEEGQRIASVRVVD